MTMSGNSSSGSSHSGGNSSGSGSGSGSESILQREPDPMEAMIMNSIDLSVIKGDEEDDIYGQAQGQEADLRGTQVKFKEDVANGADIHLQLDTVNEEDDPPPEYGHLD